jgi:TrmH family RNA methyltransferase
MNLPDPITSPSNPRVKQAAALRAADARRANGLTLVDGRRELFRAATAGVEIVEVFVAADAVDDPAVAKWLADVSSRGTRVAVLAAKAFDRVAFGDRDEGIVGVVRFGPRPLAATAFPAGRPVLVIEGVEKPGNLGAIIRTADAAGLGGVIACDARTDVANPAAIRSSLGTIFAMPIATATAAEVIRWCRATGRRAVAATPGSGRLWHAVDLTGDVAIVLGSEAHGISAAWLKATEGGELAVETVMLPMRGIADSLNLSVTAAVLAYESLRQQEIAPR